MDKILHHLGTMGNRCSSVSTRVSSFPGFLRWCESDFVHPQYVPHIPKRDSSLDRSGGAQKQVFVFTSQPEKHRPSKIPTALSSPKPRLLLVLGQDTLPFAQNNYFVFSFVGLNENQLDIFVFFLDSSKWPWVVMPPFWSGTPMYHLRSPVQGSTAKWPWVKSKSPPR